MANSFTKDMLTNLNAFSKDFTTSAIFGCSTLTRFPPFTLLQISFEISKVAFQQKRKKIKTALKDYIDEESSKKLSLDLNLRPQELTPENYLAIAEINS